MKTFGTSGKKWQKDTTWGTYNITTVKTYSGPANLRNALVYSDNIYFGKLALKMGKDKLKDELNRLGFNKSINERLSMTSSKFLSGDDFERRGSACRYWVWTRKNVNKPTPYGCDLHSICK